MSIAEAAVTEPVTTVESLPDDDRVPGPRVMLALAVFCWLAGLLDVNVRGMNGVGLLAVLRPEFYLSAGLLTVGFVWACHREPTGRRLLSGYLVTLVAFFHATPALLYGTVRYSWSWKHIGMVDYIERTGGIDPDERFLSIYHAWPGLFSYTAFVSEATGVEPTTIAIWTPFALTLGAVLALGVLLNALTVDPRVRWFALWLYVCANWVGQEYFSPQGVSYALYLGLLALALTLERRGIAGVDAPLESGAGLSPTSTGERRAARFLVVIVVVVIVASHQLTPIMVVATFAVAAVVRASRTGWVAVAGAAAMLVWLAGPAWTYISDNVFGLTDSLGSPTDSSAASFADTTRVGTGQLVVVIADRFLTQAIVVLAIAGLLSGRLPRPRARLVLVAMCAPIVLLVTDYGGEVLFRAYLFALPWLAIAGAAALAGRPGSSTTRFELISQAVVLVALLTSFLFAYLGKERANFFTDDEVAVSAWLYDTAPDNSLLVEGSRNYPGSSLEYEKFFYVPIDREPAATHARIQADPAVELHRWMSDERYAASFLILTRSMKAGELVVPAMPPGIIDDIDEALSESSLFEVVRRSDDAVVYTVAENER